jgi:hypothetical protein
MSAPRPRRCALVGLLAALLLSACDGTPPTPPRARPADWQRRALAGAPGADAVPLRVVVPAADSVVPWTFPALVLRWADDFRANAFLVRVLAGAPAEPVLELFTTERHLALAPVEWERVRAAAGEGGAFTVELVAAALVGDRALRGPTTATARSRFSGPDEHPTGHVYYATQLRPKGAPPGPADRSHRLLFPFRVAMDGEREALLEGLFDPWMEPEGYDFKGEKRNPWTQFGVSEWAERAPEPIATRSFDYSPVSNERHRPLWKDLYPKPQGACVGCHLTRSRDQAWYAFNAAFDDRRPGKGGDTFQTLFAVRAADRQVVAEKSYGFFPRFHPQRPALLAWSQWANEFKDGFLASVYHADLRVLDLESGAEAPVPGAAEPDRCEIVPEWSPDGQRLVFTRSLPGEPCDGERGHLELAIVPWNGGRGGTATVLVPADGGANVQPRWSPDGRWIVYFRTTGGYFAQGSGDLWAVPADGSAAPHRLEVSTAAMESWHAFSPDGRWLAFQSNRDAVDRVRGYVVRFFEDGRVSPAIPLPGAGDTDAMITNLDWQP